MLWLDGKPNRTPDEEIDGIVNDWLSKHFPESWFPGKTRPSLASLRAALNLPEAAPTSSEAA